MTLDPGQHAAVALVTVALDHVLSVDRTVDYAAVDATLTDVGGFVGSDREVIAWHTAVLAALLLRGVCEQDGGDPRLLWRRFVAGLAVVAGEDA